MLDKYIPHVTSIALLHFAIDWFYHLFIEWILGWKHL